MSDDERNLCCEPSTFPSKGDVEDDLGALCKAMGHPIRVRIVRLLLEKTSCFSGDLASAIDLAPSTIWEHVRILKEAGLIIGTIDGPRRSYCVSEKALAHMLGLFQSLGMNVRQPGGFR